MTYLETVPTPALQPYIHSYWQLTGDTTDNQWERIFPDGCPGIVVNLGDNCFTDNGSSKMEHGKTYVVGAMTSFKESFVNPDTNLIGVCLKPGIFSCLYKYASQKELVNSTIEFDRCQSFDTALVLKNNVQYFNKFYTERAKQIDVNFQRVLYDISLSKGRHSISQLAGRHCTTVRQLERMFAVNIGLSPKEYSNIVRFQNAMKHIVSSKEKSLSEIAFECGYYDHAHLAHEVKRLSGLTPSLL